MPCHPDRVRRNYEAEDHFVPTELLARLIDPRVKWHEFKEVVQAIDASPIRMTDLADANETDPDWTITTTVREIDSSQIDRE